MPTPQSTRREVSYWLPFSIPFPVLTHQQPRESFDPFRGCPPCSRSAGGSVSAATEESRLHPGLSRAPGQGAGLGPDLGRCSSAPPRSTELPSPHSTGLLRSHLESRLLKTFFPQDATDRLKDSRVTKKDSKDVGLPEEPDRGEKMQTALNTSPLGPNRDTSDDRTCLLRCHVLIDGVSKTFTFSEKDSIRISILP